MEDLIGSFHEKKKGRKIGTIPFITFITLYLLPCFVQILFQRKKNNPCVQASSSVGSSNGSGSGTGNINSSSVNYGSGGSSCGGINNALGDIMSGRGYADSLGNQYKQV